MYQVTSRVKVTYFTLGNQVEMLVEISMFVEMLWSVELDVCGEFTCIESRVRRRYLP